MKAFFLLILDLIIVSGVAAFGAIAGIFLITGQGVGIDALIGTVLPGNYADLVTVPEPASQSVSDLADKAAFTDDGRKLFFKANPVIQDKASFQESCQVPEQNSAVELGCFIGPSRIYLLDLQGLPFSNEMVVVASHEMLHVAYNSLSQQEKNWVNEKLEAEVDRLNSKDLNNLLAHYAVTEPGQRSNELHSIIGTEYRSLDPELEQYYSRYFQDRSKVLDYSDQFKQTFSSLQTRIDALLAEINRGRRQLRYYLAVNDVESYNAMVPELNRVIHVYNDIIKQYQLLSNQLQNGSPQQPVNP